MASGKSGWMQLSGAVRKTMIGRLGYTAESGVLLSRQQLVGMTGPNVVAEVMRCWRNSTAAYACYCDDTIISAFGVIETNPFLRHGIIWMLATTETAKHKIYTGKKTREGIRAFLCDWAYLYNYVDKGNDATIAWLRWLGAVVHEAQPMGLYGFPYHLFEFFREKE